MMFKKNLILVAVLALTLVLTSCGTIIPEINLNHKFESDVAEEQTQAGTEAGEEDTVVTETSGTDTESKPIFPGELLDEVGKQAVCATLTRLSEVNPAALVLTTVVNTGSAELTSVYTINGSEVNYTVEKLNTFTIVDGVIVRPDTYKTTHTGVATVENGKVISVEGDIVELPAYTNLQGGFTFKPDNFTDVTQDADQVSFRVLDATSFWGSSLEAENMCVTVHYSAERLVSLSATYETSGGTVTTTYDFQ